MKYLNGDYYVEVKGRRYTIIQKKTYYQNSVRNQNLLELNIKFKSILKLEKTKKLLRLIMMN